jgi:hypothetical protein
VEAMMCLNQAMQRLAQGAPGAAAATAAAEWLDCPCMCLCALCKAYCARGSPPGQGGCRSCCVCNPPSRDLCELMEQERAAFVKQAAPAGTLGGIAAPDHAALRVQLFPAEQVVVRGLAGGCNGQRATVLGMAAPSSGSRGGRIVQLVGVAEQRTLHWQHLLPATGGPEWASLLARLPQPPALPATATAAAVLQACHAHYLRQYECLMDKAVSTNSGNAEAIDYLRMAWAISEALLCFSIPGAAARAAADRASQMRQRVAAAAVAQVRLGTDGLPACLPAQCLSSLHVLVSMDGWMAYKHVHGCGPPSPPHTGVEEPERGRSG